MSASLAVSTRKAYRRFIQRFNDFCSSKSPALLPLPASNSAVCLFIAYIHESDFAASSICSHLSEISFSHRLSGYPDPCQSFIIQRLILGCKKGSKTSDCCRPILKPMLHQLVRNCSLLEGGYNQILYQAILLVTYYGFFRLGEILPSKNSLSHKVVQLDHISYTPAAVIITLHNYKTRRSQKPMLVSIKAIATKPCPVKTLMKFLNLRGKKQGPLFVHWNGKPVLTSQFNKTFKFLLHSGNFSSTVYKAHSLRIGACTQAILSGVPERIVMDLGRWKSYSAFKRYVRLQELP